MPKMVSFVFKTLIMTVLIAMLVSFAACMIDIFVTTTRIQSLAQMIQFDVAQNNCLLNDTYTGFKDELYNISTRSSYMKVCYNGDSPTAIGYSDVVGNSLLSQSPAINLYKSGTDASQRYIQLDEDDTGVLDNGTTIGTGKFAVANYGDILELDINTVVNPRMWALGSDGSNGASMSDFSLFALGGVGGHNLTLHFTVPALTYIK